MNKLSVVQWTILGMLLLAGLLFMFAPSLSSRGRRPQQGRRQGQKRGAIPHHQQQRSHRPTQPMNQPTAQRSMAPMNQAGLDLKLASQQPRTAVAQEVFDTIEEDNGPGISPEESTIRLEYRNTPSQKVEEEMNALPRSSASRELDSGKALPNVPLPPPLRDEGVVSSFDNLPETKERLIPFPQSPDLGQQRIEREQKFHDPTRRNAKKSGDGAA